MKSVRYFKEQLSGEERSGQYIYKAIGMAKTTLTVIVSKGKPPAPIIVRCFKDGKHFLDLNSPGSFNHHFTDLLEGDYDIFITGFNDAAGGDTTCYISEEEVKLMPPHVTPVKCADPFYLVQFRFTVDE